MFLELHILQNFAPSNLNRDDTGSPKDCEFGGYRRARISSQCLKRSIRQEFERDNLLPAEHRAHRTKRLVERLAKRLGGGGRDEAAARLVVHGMLRAAGFGLDKDGLTEYLLYVGEREIAGLTQACIDHWDAFAALGAVSDPAAGAGRGRQAKNAAGAGLPDNVKNSLLAKLDGGKAADLALFGRMLADLPQKNVDAAAQVAHAISTNKVVMEFDFYTAVDDFKPDDTAGAGMMGTVEFNSACFYRYANVDLRQLAENLADAELVDATVDAFLRASVSAIPTGKQHSMAAQSPPSLVLAVVRRSGLWSLANAFVDPVAPGRDGDLIASSIHRLVEHWTKLTRMFKSPSFVGTAVAVLEDAELGPLADGRVETIDELVARVQRLRAEAASAAVP